MALEAVVWVETVLACGRRFMAAWREEEVQETRLDFARGRQR